MTKQFKVKWVELRSPDFVQVDTRSAYEKGKKPLPSIDQLEDRQAVAVKKLTQTLKQDGFALSHTDEEDFAVYLPTGKTKRGRKA